MDSYWQGIKLEQWKDKENTCRFTCVVEVYEYSL